MAESVPIPEPAGLPLLGNIATIDKEFPLGSMMSLADQYGEIYRLRFPGRSAVVVSTRALVDEVCNEKRFKKSVNATLMEIRQGVHDGLFTAKMGEENWGIAHRVLMPAFGPLSIRGMFDEMYDIASQLALKWARYGPAAPIMVTDDFTRLTLDTLALCSMGFRFNSYYSPTLHPFIEAMGDFLVEAGNRGRRPPLPSLFYRSQDQKYSANIGVLRSTAKEVLEARKKDPESTRNDLLDAMLRGVDSKTGRKMVDESIMDNLITFLIAGHETTSGLLSFTFYQLLKHPDCYRKAQEEVDRVVGKGPIKVDHLSKLPYMNGVLRETLRVNATIPLFTVEPLEDTIIGGKYRVAKGETIVNLLAKSHLDPTVFGEDAGEFKPERMLDAEFDRINREFPNAWKPFGNGMRACIGRPFAWQEALLVMAMLLQNFNFVLEPSYAYAIKQTLTIKPKDMHMRAILRDGLTPTTLERRLAGLSGAAAGAAASAPSAASSTAQRTQGGSSPSSPIESKQAGAPLTVLYGSNSGTCEALARQVAVDAVSHGFRATRVDCLDSANGKLPTDEPLVIITASYEGQPPDNAGHFVAWIEGIEKNNKNGNQKSDVSDDLDGSNPLKGVSYAVFGCGHKDWVQTFHRIPKLVDGTLARLGADRLAEIGLTDASGGEVFTNFETWEDETLWPALTARYSPSAPKSNGEAGKGGLAGSNVMKVRISTPRTSALRQDVQEAIVVAARVLTKPGAGGGKGETDGRTGEEATSSIRRIKKHVEIKLPDGMAYSTGDYLAVLPINPVESVQRVLRRFHLPRDAYITIESPDGATGTAGSTSAAASQTSLPVNSSVPAFEVLSSYLELSQPATKRNLLTLSDLTADDETKEKLGRLAGESYTDEIGSKRVSVLDILDRFPSINVPIGTFLSMMPPMRVRQYSISSSPMWKPSHVTLTFSVLCEPSLSGGGRNHIGVASSYLNSLDEGDAIHVAIRPSHAAFGLPSDPEKTPVLCIAAGTGLAPFRGFIQERAAMIGAGRSLAPALFFFGCRSPEKDDLYREEMDQWQRLGAVDMRRAFSRKPDKSLGCRHVQDRILLDRQDVVDIWNKGAKVFVCGSRGVAESVKEVAIKVRLEMAREKGEELDEDAATNWFEALRNVRYATDVFD